MREIKYRGFDAENNCWRYGWYSRLQDGARKYDAIICDEGGTLTRYYIHDDDTIGQFTGLHDKNGVEIYEGDKVSTDLDRPFNIVVFRAGAFRFNCNDGEEDYHDAMLPSHKDGTIYRYGEVIGNIYEGEPTC